MESSFKSLSSGWADDDSANPFIFGDDVAYLLRAAPPIPGSSSPVAAGEHEVTEAALEHQWSLMRGHIVPYEANRSMYRTKYQRPVIVSMNPKLWRRMTSRCSIARALDVLLLLGFVPAAALGEEDIEQWGDTTRTEGIRLRLVVQDKQVSFDEPALEPTIERLKDLELEVKDLTRQLRIMKASTLSGSGRDARPQIASVVNDETPPPSAMSEIAAPTPVIIQTPGKSLVASTSGGTLICLPVNFLEPDLVPYVVSMSMNGGANRYIACTIVEHRFVVFIAPPNSRGSVAVTLLCTSGNQLRRYAKSVWIEYNVMDDVNVLSHHAVNQLVQDIPLPSSATLGDPSDGTEYKSEAASCFDDQDDVISNCSAGTIVPEQHPPLTREMLDMIPFNHSSTVAVRQDRIEANNHRRSMANSECSEPTVASSMPTTFLASHRQDVISISAASVE